MKKSASKKSKKKTTQSVASKKKGKHGRGRGGIGDNLTGGGK